MRGHCCADSWTDWLQSRLSGLCSLRIALLVVLLAVLLLAVLLLAVFQACVGIGAIALLFGTPLVTVVVERIRLLVLRALLVFRLLRRRIERFLFRLLLLVDLCLVFPLIVVARGGLEAVGVRLGALVLLLVAKHCTTATASLS